MINELKSANSAKIGKIFKEARNDIGISKRAVSYTHLRAHET